MVRVHFELIKPYRSQAIENTSKNELDSVVPYRTHQSALSYAFIWKYSPQGYRYWSLFYDTIGEMKTIKESLEELTIRELLEELSEPYRSEAIENTPSHNMGKASKFHQTPRDALRAAFAWNYTKQGARYWYDYYNTLPDSPTK